MKLKNNLPIAIEWLKKAQEDEMAAVCLLKEKTSFSVICFLSQQVAEKSLKAFLAYYDKDIPKIHYLEKLLLLCSEEKKVLLKYKKEVILLSEYYIETRYPGDVPDGFSLKDAENALASAQKIKNDIMNRIKIYEIN